MVKDYYLDCTCRYLKVPLKEFILELKTNPPPHILCATPGRLYDIHSRENLISFKHVKMFVLDEAGNVPVYLYISITIYIYI